MKALAVALVLAATTQVAVADRLEDAKKHFVTGKAAHDAGRYDEAIREYQAAYDLAPLPELLFNLGQVYRLQGDKQKAVDHYAKYLLVAPNGPVASDARKYQEQLEKELASTPAPTPEPDPAIPTTTPPPEVAPTPTTAVAPPMPAPAPVREQPAQPGRGLRIAGFVAVGVGLVAAGGAVKFGLDARSASDDLSTIDDGLWDPEDNARIEEGERAQTLMLVSTGVAAAAIGTGVVLYLMGNRQTERANVALVPRDGGGVFSWSGRF